MAVREHKIEVLKDDRERVRKRPTIYIPDIDKIGALHLDFEIFDNSIDEVESANSVGNSIIMRYDTVTREVVCIDDGGGIPQDKMLESVTVLNSSGKFHNDENSHFQMSTGVNGCGSVITNYLSEYYYVTSKQHGKSLTYKFVDGLLKDTIKSKISTKDHGTIVTFKLDQRFVNGRDVTAEMIRNRIKEKSYIHPKVKMEFVELKDGKLVKSSLFYGKDIADRLNKMDPDIQPIRATGKKKVTLLAKITDEQLTDKAVIYDVIFSFNEDILDAENPNDYIVSYCNGATTYMHGTHVDGLKDALVKFFRDRINDKKKESDPTIMPSDCYAGLCAVVSASTNEPIFRGQYKDSAMSQELKFAVRDAVLEELEKAPKGVIKEFEEFIKRVAKGRQASKKIRRKDVSNSFSKDRIEKYYKFNRTSKTISPEVIIVEGDSAAGVVMGVRDPYNQGVFSVKKPANVYDMDLDTVRGMATAFNQIMDIFGLVPGPNCDISKSQVDRLCIMSDQDTDGIKIGITIAALIAKHCPNMIRAGMVCRILPPAYQIYGAKNTKKKPVFVHTQREFFDYVGKEFIKNTKVSYKKKELSKKELEDLTAMNFEKNYSAKLKNLAQRYNCDPKLMERIAWYYHGDMDSQKQSDWSKVLKPYKDIKASKEGDHIIISGTMDSDTKSNGGYNFIHVPLDAYFHKRVMKFKNIQNCNKDIYNFSINGEDGKSIGDIMALFETYIPDDVVRFKGLGELDGNDMWDLCLDPKKREVYVFKFEDFEKDMNKISVIMSSRKEFVEERAKIMMNRTLEDLDLDT